MTNRLISLLLVVIMVLTMSACGGGGDTSEGGGQAQGVNDAAQNGVGDNAGSADVGDMTVVRCAFPSFNDVSDSEMVEAEINKVLAEKYGIQTDITFINTGSWQQQSTLLLTGDEVDVITLWPLPLSTFINNRQLLPLDSYLETASDELKNKFTEEQWKACQSDGVQYSIPNLRNYGSIFICFWDEAKLAELGYKAEEITTLDQIEEVLYAAHEKYPDIYTIVPQGQANFVNGVYWDGLGDQNYIGVLGDCGQDTTVTDIFECQDFIDFVTRTRKWYLDGLMMGDALSNQETGSTMIQNGAAFASLTNRACEPAPAGLTQSQFVDGWSDSTNITALTYGINALSPNPDEAWTMLEALYCDTDVQQLLINGIEGIHYVDNGDGSVSYPDGVTSSSSTYGEGPMYWSLPYANADVTPNTELGPATFLSDLIEFNNACTPSIATGITIDTEAMGVVDEYAACLNVKDKYYNGLMNGILDPETTLPQAHQEMVDAGIEKICAAKQQVLDEFLANKQ